MSWRRDAAYVRYNPAWQRSLIDLLLPMGYLMGFSAVTLEYLRDDFTLV